MHLAIYQAQRAEPFKGAKKRVGEAKRGSFCATVWAGSPGVQSRETGVIEKQAAWAGGKNKQADQAFGSVNTLKHARLGWQRRAAALLGAPALLPGGPLQSTATVRQQPPPVQCRQAGTLRRRAGASAALGSRTAAPRPQTPGPAPREACHPLQQGGRKQGRGWGKDALVVWMQLGSKAPHQQCSTGPRRHACGQQRCSAAALTPSAAKPESCAPANPAICFLTASPEPYASPPPSAPDWPGIFWRAAAYHPS